MANIWDGRGLTEAEELALNVLDVKPPHHDYTWRDVLEAYRMGRRDGIAEAKTVIERNVSRGLGELLP